MNIYGIALLLVTASSVQMQTKTDAFNDSVLHYVMLQGKQRTIAMKIECVKGGVWTTSIMATEFFGGELQGRMRNPKIEIRVDKNPAITIEPLAQSYIVQMDSNGLGGGNDFFKLLNQLETGGIKMIMRAQGRTAVPIADEFDITGSSAAIAKMKVSCRA